MLRAPCAEHSETSKMRYEKNLRNNVQKTNQFITLITAKIEMRIVTMKAYLAAKYTTITLRSEFSSSAGFYV